MRPVFFALFFCIALAAIALYYEYDHITYFLTHRLLSSENHSGYPSPRYIRDAALSLVTTLPMTTTFIDFGCGDGDMIDDIVKHDPGRAVVGVELDTEQARKAQQRFAGNPLVQIRAMDMVEYAFPETPFVLYMYEPLWCLKKEDALPIYKKVIDSIKTPCHILYINGANHILDNEFFTSRGFHLEKTIHKARFMRWEGTNLYVYSRGAV